MTNKKTRIMVVNAQGASASVVHSRRVVRKAFNEAIANRVDIIVWSEVADVDVYAIGMEVDTRWWTEQFGKPKNDDPRSGLAISWNEIEADLRNFSIETGTDATSEGRWKTGSGIRMRPIMSSTIVEPINARLHAIHPPPMRAPRARGKYMEKALKKPGIIAGDSNFIRVALNKMVRRRNVKSVGLLTIITPKRFWVSKPTKVNVGSDHLAFFVDIEPERPRKRRLARLRRKDKS